MDQVLRPTVVFESRGMPPAAAIDAWREIAGPTLRVEIDREDQDRFSLKLQAVRLVETVVTAAETTAQAMHRDQDRANRDGLDQYGFFLQVTGSRIVRVNDVDTILMPGDLQFVDMAQDDYSIATDGKTTTLYVPRHLVESEVPDAWQLHGAVFRNTAARVFAHQALTLFDPECSWSTAMAAYLERCLLSIGLGCLYEMRPGIASSLRSSIERSMRRRIELYIDDHLANHNLDAHSICLEFGMSRSQVYRVFHTYGGLSRYILGCRLRRVRKLLVEGDERSIAEIAIACGFVSPAHFSREFRRTFGTTPREMRGHPQQIGNESVASGSLDQFFRSIDAPVVTPEQARPAF
ncbi:MAG TPA: AraC family transcriptional regulator [Thermomicrobiales bacterium]|nr:AraC family transcriptional regulator [Thermomicrobiales bacterium]